MADVHEQGLRRFAPAGAGPPVHVREPVPGRQGPQLREVQTAASGPAGVGTGGRSGQWVEQGAELLRAGQDAGAGRCRQPPRPVHQPQRPVGPDGRRGGRGPPQSIVAELRTRGGSPLLPVPHRRWPIRNDRTAFARPGSGPSCRSARPGGLPARVDLDVQLDRAAGRRPWPAAGMSRAGPCVSCRPASEAHARPPLPAATAPRRQPGRAGRPPDEVISAGRDRRAMLRRPAEPRRRSRPSPAVIVQDGAGTEATTRSTTDSGGVPRTQTSLRSTIRWAERGDGDGLHVVRVDEVPPAAEREGTRQLEQGQRATGAGPHLDVAVVPGAPSEVHHVARRSPGRRAPARPRSAEPGRRRRRTPASSSTSSVPRATRRANSSASSSAAG